MFPLNNHDQPMLWDPILNVPGVSLVSQILVVLLLLLTVGQYVVRVFMEIG
jgi:hypothetical protein